MLESKIERKGNKKLFAIVASCLFLVITGVSSAWWLKSSAFLDVVESTLNKDGGQIKVLDFGGQSISIEGSNVFSKLKGINRIGFPFNPGVEFDVDLKVLAPSDEPLNHSSIETSLRGVKLQTGLFSSASLTAWMPEIIDAITINSSGVKEKLLINNKGLLLQLSEKDSDSSVLLRGRNVVVSTGLGDTKDVLQADNVLFSMDVHDSKTKFGVSLQGLRIILAEKTPVSFVSFDYASSLKNKPNFETPEGKKVLWQFRAQPSNLVTWKKIIGTMAKAGTDGLLDFKVVQEKDSFFKLQAYMNKDKAHPLDMDMQANVEMVGIDKILQQVRSVGLPSENIEQFLAVLKAVSKPTVRDGIEHVNMVLKYSLGVISLDNKPIIHLM